MRVSAVNAVIPWIIQDNLSVKQKIYERRWVCIYRLLYMKNSVLDRLKSYFDEYFSDATKPTARNLFLIIVSILALDIFRSVRFAHRHVLAKLSDTSLNAYYYALKTDRLDHESWRNVTLSKALKAVPVHLAAQPLFLSIDAVSYTHLTLPTILRV